MANKIYRIAILPILLYALASNADENIDIVVSKANTIDHVSPEEIYDIFIFQNDVWNNGEPITVITLPLHSSEHREFLYKYTGLNYLGYSRRFNNRINSGRGRAPIIVKNYDEMLKTVGEHTGSVGYNEKTVTSLMEEYGIKVLEVY